MFVGVQDFKFVCEGCSLTENPFTQRSESQIREQHNEIEFFRMTF